MRTLGIDLSITSEHRAAILDDRGDPVGKVQRLRTDPTDLEDLLRKARDGVDQEEPLRAVMEPTGLAWLPVASYLIQRGVTVYLVDTQQVADLRRFYSKHAKSDRIDARVLARLPWVNPDALHPLQLADAHHRSGQRWCKQQEELSKLMSAVKNRVRAGERTYWPGLEEVVGDPFTPWMTRWRQEWYDPWKVQAADPTELACFLVHAGVKQEQGERLAAGLQRVARRAIALFGTPQGDPSPYVDYASLQDQVLRELRLLDYYRAEHKEVRRRVQGLYRQTHPTRHLETIYGVGEDGAAVYTFFVIDVTRFATQKAFRSWSGMVPGSAQSGGSEKKGLRITAAGPNLIKKYAYIDAEIARQWDPQIAAIYYDQMVNKGKHHSQAVCHCATHLLDRIRAVLRDGCPYELRDVDNRAVTWQEARAIIAERYQVPHEVRRRRSQRASKALAKGRAERRQRKRRRSRSAWQEAGALTPPQPELTPPQKHSTKEPMQLSNPTR